MFGIMFVMIGNMIMSKQFHSKLRNAVISMRETVDKSSGMWMCLFISKWEEANKNGLSHEEFFDFWVDQIEKGYLEEVLEEKIDE